MVQNLVKEINAAVNFRGGWRYVYAQSQLGYRFRVYAARINRKTRQFEVQSLTSGQWQAVNPDTVEIQ